MKKIIILGMVSLFTVTAYSDSTIDFKRLSQQALASTDLNFCFQSAFLGKTSFKNCDSLQNKCRELGLTDQDIARIYLQAKNEIIFKLKAKEAIHETDEKLKSDIEKIMELNPELESLIFNY